MLKLVFSPKAHEDFDRVYDYFAEAVSVGFADRVVDAVYSSIETLCANPAIGVSAGEHRTGLRIWMAKKPAHKYRIFFCTLPESIEIVRILHGAQSEVEAFDEDSADAEEAS